MSEKQVRDYDKFMLRFPDGMRDAIAERAKANGRSMNSEIVQILEDALEGPIYVNFSKIKKDYDQKSPSERDVYLKKLEREHPKTALILKASEEHMMTLLRILSDSTNNKPT